MTFSDEIYEKVCRFSESEHLIEKGDSVLCALSGGADSVALLKILGKMREKYDIALYAAHLNHGIRGAEADRDEEFCVRLCRSEEIEIDCAKADIPAEARKSGTGTEECARNVRYRFLEEIAEKRGCNKIATAHHADDNIETVLLHMIRGSGLSGLTGIKPKRGKIIRPLLVCRKSELEKMLAQEGSEYVTDSTNSEVDASRNYIRHMVLPHIYHLNGSADKAIGRMCRSLSEDSEYMYREAGKISGKADLTTLSALPDPILSRYLILKYRKCKGKTEVSPDSSAVAETVRAVRQGKTVRFDICGDVTVSVSRFGVDMENRTENGEKEFEIRLSEGENFISSIGYRILITADKKVADDWQNIYKLSTCKSVNFDKLTVDGKLCLSARNLRAEDRYMFSGYDRSVRKQLKKQGVPLNRRNCTPCICTARGEIILVLGLDVADGFRTQPGSKTGYIIYDSDL